MARGRKEREGSTWIFVQPPFPQGPSYVKLPTNSVYTIKMQFSFSATYASSKKHQNRFKHAEIRPTASQVCIVLRTKYCGILLNNVTVFKFLPRDAMHTPY